MKNLVKWFGIIAFVAIIGLAFAACELPDELDGTTWTATMGEGDDATTVTLAFAKSEFTWTASSGGQSQVTKGDYELSGSDVTLTAKSGGSGQMKGKLSGDKLTINEIPFKKK